MGGIGGPELLIIFVVVLLIFGPKKIPEVARGIGKGLREIRRLNTEFQREINLADATPENEKSIRPPRSSAGELPRPLPHSGKPGGSVERADSRTTAGPEPSPGPEKPTEAAPTESETPVEPQAPSESPPEAGKSGP